MKKKFFIANWKSNKSTHDTRDWLEEFLIQSSTFTDTDDRKIILCPPFPLLPICHEFISQRHMNLMLGSQDISSFVEGAYTGAVSGKLLREFVSYAIIGHSERRRYFHETYEDVKLKAQLALSVGITPVYCIADMHEKIPAGVSIVAYEPIASIGSGKPDSPEDVEAVARFIKQKNDVLYVLYGGSVTAKNVIQYTSLSSIDGVLVGGASLSSSEFISIIQHA